MRKIDLDSIFGRLVISYGAEREEQDPNGKTVISFQVIQAMERLAFIKRVHFTENRYAQTSTG